MVETIKITFVYEFNEKPPADKTHEWAEKQRKQKIISMINIYSFIKYRLYAAYWRLKRKLSTDPALEALLIWY
jgi:hypothetical protein